MSGSPEDHRRYMDGDDIEDDVIAVGEALVRAVAANADLIRREFELALKCRVALLEQIDRAIQGVTAHPMSHVAEMAAAYAALQHNPAVT